MSDSRDLLAELTQNRPMRRRGIERYHRILDVTEKLLSDSGDEDIGLAQIAEQAEISLASVYYFFPNRNAVYAALALRFNDEIYERSIRPLTDPEPQSWQELLDMKHKAAAEFQNSRPAALRLFLGAGVSAAVRSADFIGNARLARSRARMFEAYFDIQNMPDLPHWLEMSAAAMDGIWSLSYGYHGVITEEYRAEATACAVTYLRRFLPEYLTRIPVTQASLDRIRIELDMPSPTAGLGLRRPR
ncbi:TetR/AcrR family transcriptional regulator [Pukyongiella litopenaei]|uniref:TetR/AcrR family transcriptional regulator n=1 Tax=Pukyongiella litopenaei TaxID=2605946 RepID=A0A2S0MR18_9RHOB|nr:TetR/AcrR family transcriptional regulator [Pukyongiella litopenaei]AVO38286.2 TetR/AcrR family transcriptional regulator [Pukyongiella litopenaei]